MVKHAAIYVRISDDRTGEAAGVARQESDCRTLAQRKGWPIAEVYRDNDISAFNGHRRPDYERLLENMRNRTVDAVVVWHEDRLHRQPRELEQFIDIATASHVQLATVTGEIDLGTPEGRLRARMLGNVGAYESEHKAVRIRRKHEELAQQGRVSGGGSRPFGYEDDRVTIRASEATLIRKAVQRVLAGDSLRAISREWNAAGVRTTQGKEWRPNVLRRVFVSGRISGQREHHGEIISKAEWPAIISPTLTRRLRAMLNNPSRRTNGAFVARSYLLGDFLVCGVCKAKLRSRGRPHGARAYACKAGPGFGGHGCVQVAAEPLEELVIGWVFEALDTPALSRAIAARHRKSEDDIEDTTTADEEQLAQLAQDFADRRIGRSEWLVARDAVQKRLDVARDRLAHQNGTSAIAEFVGTGALAKSWPGLSLDRKRAIIGTVLDHVTIKPAKRRGGAAGVKQPFDVQRVTPVWRY